MKILFLFLIMVCLLTACGKKDADFYINNPEEMKAKLEECSKMSSAEAMADRECSAVSQADSKRFYGDKIKQPLQDKPKGRPTKQF